MTTADLIRTRLDAIAAAAQTAAEALDGAALDLCPGTLAEILSELEALDVRLDLALDRLASAVDPVGLAAAGRER
jgi:hypothetical protein